MTGPERAVPSIDLLERIRQLSDPQARRRSGCFFAEGVRNLIAAHDAHAPIEEMVASSRLLTSVVGQKVLRLRKRAGTRCLPVTPEQFRSISTAKRASGVGIVVRQPWERLDAITVRADSLWIAVSQVARPGNLGTILRTAEAVGAEGLIVLGEGVDPFDPGVVRGSMGALFRQRIVRSNVRQLREWSRRSGVRVIGAAPRAARRFDEEHYRGPVVLFFGSERKGLASGELRACDAVVRLPMREQVDSLNLGVAAGVLLYEVYRSRGFEEPARVTPSPAESV